MFNELYDQLKSFLEDTDDFVFNYYPLSDPGLLPTYLSTVYQFNKDDIKKVLKVNLRGGVNILLLLANGPKDKPYARYTEVIMFEGIPYKVVLFNITCLKKSGQDSLLHLAISLWSSIFCITEHYDRYIEKKNSSALTNVLYYAPIIMSVKLMDKLYDAPIDPEAISLIYQSLYKTDTINAETIKAIRKLNKDYSIYELLDNSLITAVDMDMYGLALFGDNKENENDKSDNI